MDQTLSNQNETLGRSWEALGGAPASLPCAELDALVAALVDMPHGAIELPDYIQFDSSSLQARTAQFRFPPLTLEVYSDADPTFLREHDYALRRGLPCSFVDFQHYTCNICTTVNADLYEFNRHMRDHIRRNDTKCAICADRFLSSGCLNTHMASHMAVCANCDTWVPIIHLRIHSDANKAYLEKYRKHRPVSGQHKVYYCISCNEIYANYKLWVQHFGTNKHLTASINKKIERLTK